MDSLVNWFFLVVTGAVAWHGITFRDADGERDWVRLLFGCIALMFGLRVLAIDILDLPVFMG